MMTSFQLRRSAVAITTALSLAMLTLAALGTAAPVEAADAAGPGFCRTLVRSPLLDLPAADMQQHVATRYDRSVQVANAAPTIYSTSPRFVWASEAKVACGMAIGFFGGGEVNEDAVSKCDCFYGRMLTYTGALR